MGFEDFAKVNVNLLRTWSVLVILTTFFCLSSASEPSLDSVLSCWHELWILEVFRVRCFWTLATSCNCFLQKCSPAALLALCGHHLRSPLFWCQLQYVFQEFSVDLEIEGLHLAQGLVTRSGGFWPCCPTGIYHSCAALPLCNEFGSHHVNQSERHWWNDMEWRFGEVSPLGSLDLALLQTQNTTSQLWGKMCWQRDPYSIEGHILCTWTDLPTGFRSLRRSNWESRKTSLFFVTAATKRSCFFW